MEVVARIVHISDTHFGLREFPPLLGPRGSSRDQLANWQRARAYIAELNPDLILLTGDVVDSPSLDRFRRAADALRDLKSPVRICAGNHDLHPTGVHWRISSRSVMQRLGEMQREFGPLIAANLPETVQVGPLKVGIAALDSARDVGPGGLATGFVSEAQLQNLQSGVTQHVDRARWDLFFLLVHHHVLSIAATETPSAAQSVNTTAFVNASQVLERAIDLGVDVIFHGHEHVRNFARYATAAEKRRWRAEVAVCAAGSAVGVTESKWARQENATLNLVEVRSDGSVRAEAHRCATFDKGRQLASWVSKETALLCAPDVTREHHLARQVADATSGDRHNLRLAHCTKWIHFGDNADIQVKQTLDGVWFPEPSRKCSFVNGTGRVIDAAVAVTSLLTGESTGRIPITPAPMAMPAHWEAHVPLGSAFVQTPVRFEQWHTWQGGAVRTKAELQAIESGGRADNERVLGYEYVWALVPNRYPIRRSELLLSFDVSIAPEHVEVVARPVGSQDPNEVDGVESSRAQASLTNIDRLRWQLMLDFPRRDRLYVLRWLPR